jgi:hypothetical protein
LRDDRAAIDSRFSSKDALFDIAMDCKVSIEKSRPGSRKQDVFGKAQIHG